MFPDLVMFDITQEVLQHVRTFVKDVTLKTTDTAQFSRTISNGGLPVGGGFDEKSLQF